MPRSDGHFQDEYGYVHLILDGDGVEAVCDVTPISLNMDGSPMVFPVNDFDELRESIKHSSSELCKDCKFISITEW